MNDVCGLRRALVSVSDKQGLEELAKLLVDTRVEVLSTGGTAKALAELGVAVVKVSDYTEAPEILGGRVKTLHPKIHGGILAMPTPEHDAELAHHAIAPIDLVVVNLYPFAKTIADPARSFADAIENIDIGGPTMLRAAAKNWARVTVVVDPADYAVVAADIAATGGVTAAVRRRLSRKAFAHTAAYDAAIATYLAGWDDDGARLEDAMPSFWMTGGPARGELRYGENPHQPAAFYVTGEPGGLDGATQLQGKPLSYNNLLDADAALQLVRDLAELGPAAAVIKHATPCGAAIGAPGSPLAEVYARAQQADAESAFGGIVALSMPCDGATASLLAATFLEVVLAPSFEPAAREVLAKKTNLRLLELDTAAQPSAPPHAGGRLRARSVAGGLLVQRTDAMLRDLRSADVVTGDPPSESRWAELELAWRVVAHVRSNAIAIVADGVTVGLGGGQTSRVESVRQALARAGDRARGATLASDAFFPFRDNIDRLAEAGIATVIQPGGSVRDAEVIAAAKEHGITMLFTGERHFRH